MIVAPDAARSRTDEPESELERRVVRSIQHVLAGFGVLLVCFVGGGPPLLLHPIPALGLLAATVACIVAHPWLLPERRGRRWTARLHLRPIAGPALPWVLAAAVTFALFNLLMPPLAGRYISAPMPPAPPYAHSGEPLGYLVVPVHAILFAPFAEELGLRGYMQSSLVRTLGRPVALVTTATLFALLHGSLAWAPLVMFGGLVFGGALLATRSLPAAVLLHMAANAATLAFIGRDLPGWLRRLVDGPLMWLLVPLLAAATVALLRQAYRSRPRTEPGARAAGPRARGPTAPGPEHSLSRASAAHHHCS